MRGSNGVAAQTSDQTPLVLIALNFITSIVTITLHLICDGLWMIPSRYVKITHNVLVIPSPWVVSRRTVQRSPLALLSSSTLRLCVLVLGIALVVLELCCIQYLGILLGTANGAGGADERAPFLATLLLHPTIAQGVLGMLSLILMVCGWARVAPQSSRIARTHEQSPAIEYIIGCITTIRDALASVGAVLVFCGLIRASALLRAMKRRSVVDARAAVRVELLRTVTDWVLVPAFLLVLAIPIRARGVLTMLWASEQTDNRNHCKNNTGMNSSSSSSSAGTTGEVDGGKGYFDSRLSLLGHAISTPIDALCYLAGLPILITCYRLREFLRQLARYNTKLDYYNSWVICGGFYSGSKVFGYEHRFAYRRAICLGGVWKVAQDFPYLLLVTAVTATIVRAPPMWRSLCASRDDDDDVDDHDDAQDKVEEPCQGPWEERQKRMILRCSALLVADIIVAICALPTLVLTLYRIPTAWRAARHLTSSVSLRVGDQMKFQKLARNDPSLVWIVERIHGDGEMCNLRSATTSFLHSHRYRKGVQIARLHRVNGPSRFAVHTMVLDQCGHVVADLVCGVLLIAMHVVACWRVYFVWREIFSLSSGASSPTTTTPPTSPRQLRRQLSAGKSVAVGGARRRPPPPQPRTHWRTVVLHHCQVALRDVPAALMCALTIIVTPYRAGAFLHDLRNPGSTSSWRVVACSYGTMCLHPMSWICFVLYVLCLHRIPGLHRWISVYGHGNGGSSTGFSWKLARRDHWKAVKAVTDTAQLAVADLFLAIAVVIVFCTGWRARTIVNSLREVKRRHKGAAMHEHGVLVLSLAPLDSRRGALQGSATELHSAAWYQVLLLIRDAPYLLCLLIGVVFFWRVPHLHHRLADAEIFAVNKDDDYEYDGTNVHSINAFLARLNIAAGHAVRGIFDLPCAVLAALLCCTWRNNEVTTFVHREWNSSSLWESLHIFTVKQLVGLLLDVPFILLAPLTLWRLPHVIGTAWDANSSSTPEQTAHSLRMVVVNQLALTALDLFCGVLVLPALCTWRGQSVWKLLRSEERTTKTLLALAIKELGQCALDAPFILLAPLTMWRLPSVLQHFVPAGERIDGGRPLLDADTTKVTLVLPPEKSMTGQGTMDGHGLRLIVQGSLRNDIHITSVQSYRSDAVIFRLTGDALWSALDRLVGVAVMRPAKMALHPLSLLTNPPISETLLLQDDDSDRELIQFEVALGTGGEFSRGPKISHATMTRTMMQVNAMIPNGGGQAVSNVSIEVACSTSEEEEVDSPSLFGRLCGCCIRPPRATMVQFAFSPQHVVDAAVAAPSLLSLPIIPEAAPQPEQLRAVEIRILVLRALALVVLDVVAVAITLPLFCTWRAAHVCRNRPPTSVDTIVFAAKQWLQCALDIIAVICLTLLLLRPWYFVAVCRGANRRRRGASRRKECAVCSSVLRRAVFTMALAAVIDVPIETFSFMCCVVAPWRFPRFVRALCGCGGTFTLRSARERRARACEIFHVALDALADAGAIVCALILAVTVWRMPYALADAQRVARNHRRGQPVLLVRFPLPTSTSMLNIPPTWPAHRRAALQLLRHVCCLPFDVIAALEVLFILLTLVNVPHSFNRLESFWIEWTNDGRPGFPQIDAKRWCADLCVLWSQAWSGSKWARRFRDAALRFAAKQDDAKGDRRVGFFDRPSVMPARVLQYCDATSLCAVQMLFKGHDDDWWKHRWIKESGGDTIWQRLVVSAFPGRGRTAGSLSWKHAYGRIVLEQRARRQAVPTQDEVDYDLGLRRLIHVEFALSLWRTPHLLLVPFKLIGLVATAPLVYFARWRKPTLERWLFNTPAGVGLRTSTIAGIVTNYVTQADMHPFDYSKLTDDGYPLFEPAEQKCYFKWVGESSRISEDHHCFWRLHMHALYSVILLVESICFELAFLIAIFFAVLIQIVTLGAALWTRALGLSFAQVGADVLLGIALPFLLGVALVVVLLPNLQWLPVIGAAGARVSVWAVEHTGSAGTWIAMLGPRLVGFISTKIGYDLVAGASLAMTSIVPHILWLRHHLEGIFEIVVAVDYAQMFDGIVEEVSTAWLFPIVQTFRGSAALRMILSPLDYLLSVELFGVRWLYMAWWSNPLWNNRVVQFIARWTWWIVTTRLARQLLWCTCVMAPATKCLHEIMLVLMPRANVFYIYRMPLRLVRFFGRLMKRFVKAVRRLIHFVWRLYIKILAVPTRWSTKGGSRWREVLLLPYTFAWIGWPLLVVWFDTAMVDEEMRPALLQLAGVVVATKLYIAKGIVTRAWYGSWLGIFGSGLFQRWVID